MRTPMLLAAAATTALAVFCAPAAADSISYVKDGDVWLTSPDGARQVQVTRDGGYTFASQADDGTLLGLHGQRLRRLDRTGRILADFSTPVSDVPAGSSFTSTGPIDPQLSPDGTKVAYGYRFQYTRFDPYCGAPNGCSTGKVMVGTGYSHADRTTAWDEPGLGRHTGWMWPSWIDDSHVLMSDVAEILNDQVWTDTVGDGANGQPWFQGTNEATVRDGELSRDGRALALVESRGWRDNEVRIYRVVEPIPARPSLCLRLDGDVPVNSELGYSSPSFSPDGRSLVLDDGRDVRIVRGMDLDGCSGAEGAGVLIPGAHDPDWGPADLPATAPGPQPGPSPTGPTPGPTVPTPSPSPTPGGAGAGLRVAVVGGRLGTVLRRGLVVRVTAPAQVTVRQAGRVVGRARGTGSVRVRLTPGARRRLARTRTARFAVQAVAGTVRRTVTVTVRR